MFRPWLPAVLLSILTAHSFAVPDAVAECPVSTFALGGLAQPWSEAVLDTSVNSGGDITGRAAFDLVAGTLALVHGGGLSPTFVVARDLFDVTGVPPGTKVVLVVELVAMGTVSSPGCGGSGCHGVLEGTITAGGESAFEQAIGTVFAPGVVPVAVAPRLAVTLVAGTPTPIEVELRGRRTPGGNHRVEATGSYRWLGLPAGTGIVSCRGFTGAPTPVQSTASWGRVKAAYH
jgi:hypothetical protein